MPPARLPANFAVIQAHIYPRTKTHMHEARLGVERILPPQENTSPVYSIDLMRCTVLFELKDLSISTDIRGQLTHHDMS